MADNAFRALVDELLAKTREGKVTWQEGPVGGTRVTDFPPYRVAITAHGKVILMDGNGELSWNEGTEEGRVKELYDVACPEARAADGVIAEIIKQLQRR